MALRTGINMLCPKGANASIDKMACAVRSK